MKVLRWGSGPRKHIGDTKSMNLRTGFNLEKNEFYIQIFHKDTNDTMRIWLDKGQYEGLITNFRYTLRQHKEQSK